MHVEYRSAEDVYEDVPSNVVDLGLVAHPHKTPGLEIVPLRKDPAVLICHPEHPLAKLKSVKLKALGGLKFVNFTADGHIRNFLDQAFRASRVKVNNVMELDNIETVKRAVEIDAGVSIAPEVTVRQEVSTATLVAVPFEDKGMERPIAVILKRNKTLSPNAPAASPARPFAPKTVRRARNAVRQRRNTQAFDERAPEPTFSSPAFGSRRFGALATNGKKLP